MSVRARPDFKLVPISSMLPRSFITDLKDGTMVPRAQPTLVRGIAFGGFHDLRDVLFSDDERAPLERS
jgi:hypothetical protein